MSVKSRKQANTGSDRDAASTNHYARSFDNVALEYDRTRPGYSSALIDDVILITRMPHGGRILEIGSGTGKATVSFAERGFEILGVEAGEKMIAIARRNLASYPKVRFHCARFEDAAVELGTYDLVIAAQSFHWVSPSVRYVKSASALKNSGWLAVFWHATRPKDTQLSRDVNFVLRSRLPKYAPISERAYERQVLEDLNRLEGCGSFTDFQLRRYQVEHAAGPAAVDNYLRSLTTWSRIAALPCGQRNDIIAELREILNGADVRALGECETILIIARKKV